MEVPQPTGVATPARDRKRMRLKCKLRALERDRPYHGQRAALRASASLAITIYGGDACARCAPDVAGIQIALRRVNNLLL